MSVLRYRHSIAAVLFLRARLFEYSCLYYRYRSNRCLIRNLSHSLSLSLLPRRLPLPLLLTLSLGATLSGTRLIALLSPISVTRTLLLHDSSSTTSVFDLSLSLGRIVTDSLGLLLLSLLLDVSLRLEDDGEGGRIASGRWVFDFSFKDPERRGSLRSVSLSASTTLYFV